MNLSNRVMATWAIAVFVAIGLVMFLISTLEGDDTDYVDQKPADTLGVVR